MVVKTILVPLNVLKTGLVSPKIRTTTNVSKFQRLPLKKKTVCPCGANVVVSVLRAILTVAVMPFVSPKTVGTLTVLPLTRLSNLTIYLDPIEINLEVD